MILAALAMIAGLVLLLTGAWQGGIEIFAGGGIVSAALAFERWRYRSASVQPHPAWQRTGERFSDSGREGTVDVYYDPATGERHYVAGRPPPP